MAGLCAVVYVILLDALERRVSTMTLVAGMARAAGGEGELPDWDTVRAEFDTHLASEPQPIAAADADRLTLLQALGLR